MVICSQSNGSQAASSTDGLIENLSKNADALYYSTDMDMLEMAKDLLDTFVSKSHTWAYAGGWSDTEMELCGKKGFDRGAAAVRLRTALSIGNSLRSFVQSYEYKIESKSDPKAKKPALLQHVEEFGENTIYGPVSAGILGGQFEIWARSNETEESFKSAPGVNLLLGAGNQSMVTALDTLNSIFIERKTVLIKHHPLRPWLIFPYSILFEPLTRRGYLAQVLDKGLSESKKLLSNTLVDHVHITGSLASFNAIKMTLETTRIDKTKEDVESMLTGELGNVSPWIVNPGKFSQREIGHMICSIIASKKNFGGSNCVAGQVIILPKHWDQLEQFKTAIKKELRRQPDSAAYYPGSKKRRAEIISVYKADQVSIIRSNTIQGQNALGDEDYIALIECGSPGDDSYNDTALKREAFGPILAIVELDYEKERENNYLLDTLVPFVNDKSNVFGCLSCNLVTPPSTLSSGKIRTAIQKLNYGMIGVNEWSALAILPASMGGIWGPWGLDKTGHSGRGFIGNHFNISRIEKMVISRNLNLPPAFDEVTQPPPMIINNLGFEWATRPASKLIFLFRVILILLQALSMLVSGKCKNILVFVLEYIGAVSGKVYKHH